MEAFLLRCLASCRPGELVCSFGSPFGLLFFGRTLAGGWDLFGWGGVMAPFARDSDRLAGAASSPHFWRDCGWVRWYWRFSLGIRDCPLIRALPRGSWVESGGEVGFFGAPVVLFRCSLPIEVPPNGFSACRGVQWLGAWVRFFCAFSLTCCLTTVYCFRQPRVELGVSFHETSFFRFKFGNSLPIRCQAEDSANRAQSRSRSTEDRSRRENANGG